MSNNLSICVHPWCSHSHNPQYGLPSFDETDASARLHETERWRTFQDDQDNVLKNHTVSN